MFHLITSSLFALAIRRKRGGVIINNHTLTREEIRRQLDVLGFWFDFIRLNELSRRLNRPVGRPFCLLTFDDGKRSNYTAVAPELQLRGVPAVFYVNTVPLSTGAALWFDRRNQLVKELGHCPAGLELSALKKLPFDQLKERLDRACARHGFEPNNTTDDIRPMSWDEVRDLARRGFAIGSHGQTHGILTNETKERAFAVIEGSLGKIGAELGTPCTTFAFSNGNYTPELARHALRCGATTIMTTDPTWVDNESPFWGLPRIQLFGGFTRARIELKLALATLPGVLPNPDGTGRAYRSRFQHEQCDVQTVTVSD